MESEVDINKYETIKKIVEGPRSTTYLVNDIDTSTEYNAIVINKEYEDSDDEKNEEEEDTLEIMNSIARLHHPTIIEFIGFSKHDFDGKENVTIITQTTANGSLLDIFQKVESGESLIKYDNTARQIILAGISRGMMLLHQNNFLHEELKPENILLDENFHPYITCFYLSKLSKSQKLQYNNSPIYFSPEIFNNTEFNEKSDIYSFGILMYQIVTDKMPFHELLNTKKSSMTPFKFMQKVTNGYRPVFDVTVKPSIKRLIERCWHSDPDKRPTFEELFDMLAYSKESIDFDDDDEGEKIDDDDEDDHKFYLDDVDEEELKEYVESIKNDDLKGPSKTTKKTAKKNTKKKEEGSDEEGLEKKDNEEDYSDEDENLFKKKKLAMKMKKDKKDDSDDDSEEEESPFKKKSPINRKASKKVDSDDDEGSEEEESPFKKKPPINKKTSKKVDSDDEESPFKKKPPINKKTSKKVDSDDEEGSEEEESPFKKKTSPTTKSSKKPDSDSDDDGDTTELDDLVTRVKNGENIGLVKLNVAGRLLSESSTKLGEGLTSTTFSVQIDDSTDSSTSFVVVKEYKGPLFHKKSNIDRTKTDRFYKENEALANLHDNNIQSSIGFYEGDDSNSPSFIFHFYKANLVDSVKKLEDYQLVSVVYEIAHAMMNVHSKNLIHRDLKPENILIDDENHAKVADFGISTLMKVEDQVELVKKSKNGFLFLSPQLLQDHEYDEKVDVYSFGMIMYFILSRGSFLKAKLQDVIDGKSFQIPKAINKVSYSIIKKCLEYLPQDRPSFKAIVSTIAKYNFLLINGIDSKVPDIKEHLKGILKKKYLKK